MRLIGLLLAIPLLAAAADDLSGRAAQVLQKNCAGCHNSALKSSGLDVSTRESLLTGGERGQAVEPGHADKSRLYRFAAGLDKPSMPPGRTLASDQLEVLREWIDAGATLEAAPAPKVEEVSAALVKLEERPVTEMERKFWAFVPPARAKVPATGDHNPIDAFLNTVLKERKLQTAPVASKRVLLRRAYLDLIGLPPTPAQLDAFLADRSADAFAKVVDQLLESPHYGERWGRHWLDVVRYSDSGGFEYDRDRLNGWRYRDYVVQAFQEDKPYNLFIQEQLAGDEISPASYEARAATGYLRQGMENNLKNEQTRMDELDDLVSTTSNAFLGLTVGCARCHNHKFDPIPQRDYYRMQAVFFPTKAIDAPLASADDVAKYGVESKRITALQTPLKQQIVELEKPYRERIADEKKSKLPEYLQTALRTPPAQRTEGQRLNALQFEKTLTITEDEVTAALSAEDKARRTEVQSEIKKLDAQRPAPLPSAMSVEEPGVTAPPSYFLHRGSPGQKGSVMQPGVVTVASRPGQELLTPTPEPASRTSGRRRAFAAWIASDENPLTARVMVNRIWQHHFGEGIVGTPSNFGKTGDRPTHPELLDWLATEFVQKGWSIKAMHRLMMNSEAYQRASDDVPASVAIDPDNHALWRMPRARLEAEIIRDSVMSVAGNLDLTVGGPAIHPYIDPALFQSSSKRTWQGKSDTDPSTWRRSVYVFSKRSIPLPMLDIFDKPDSVSSCARRNRSTIAPQALILMNNSFLLMEAGKFAERLTREAGSDTGRQVDLAFALALGRPPSPNERDNSISYVKGDANGLTDFCQALFNLNEFVYAP